MYGKLNLRGPFPLPIFGNYFYYASGINKAHMDLVKKFGKTLLFYEGGSPVVCTADPELVKIISIREFKHFTNRRVKFFQYFLNVYSFFLIIILLLDV